MSWAVMASTALQQLALSGAEAVVSAMAVRAGRAPAPMTANLHVINEAREPRAAALELCNVSTPPRSSTPTRGSMN